MPGYIIHLTEAKMITKILEERKQLNNCLIVVIRYFGGIKLGAGGLLRAYSQAANEATNISKI